MNSIAGIAQQHAAHLALIGDRLFRMLALGDVLQHASAAPPLLALSVDMSPAELMNPAHLAGRRDDAVLNVPRHAGLSGSVAPGSISLAVVRMDPPKKLVIGVAKN